MPLKKLEIHTVARITIQKHIFKHFETIDIDVTDIDGNTFEISLYDHSHGKLEVTQLPDKLFIEL